VGSDAEAEADDVGEGLGELGGGLGLRVEVRAGEGVLRVPLRVMPPTTLGWLVYEAPIHSFFRQFQMAPTPKPPCQPLALSQRAALFDRPLPSTRSSVPSALRARRVSSSLRMALPETPIDRPICGDVEGHRAADVHRADLAVDGVPALHAVVRAGVLFGAAGGVLVVLSPHGLAAEGEVQGGAGGEDLGAEVGAGADERAEEEVGQLGRAGVGVGGALGGLPGLSVIDGALGSL
jgi:hypothetical protein